MTKRDRIVVGSLVLAAILGAFWLLVVAPQRKEAAALAKKIATAQQRLSAAQSSAGQALAAKGRYEADYATVAKLGQAVPADDDVPSLVYQVDSAAQRAKIDFRSLKLVQNSGKAPPPPAAAPPAPAPSGDKGSDGGSSPPPPAAPAPPTQVAAAALPPGASVGAAGFPTMPFTFIFDGSFFNMERFLRNLGRFTRVEKDGVEVRGRLLTVDSFQLTAGRDGFPSVSASVDATAYVLPPGEGLTAGATPQGPEPIQADAPPAGASGGGTPSPSATAALTTGGSR